jgi:molecular chaperone GrpE
MKNQLAKNPQSKKDKKQDDLRELEEKLFQAQEREKRSLADYQNLLRRTQLERGQIIRFANKELILSLLPILESLEKAAVQIDDQGLNMILNEFRTILEQAGLKEIEVLGEEFDIETTEAVDQNGEGNQVVEVVKKGYTLKDEVIQHAKVVLGKK